MFQKAVVRLTLWYLGVIVLLSMFFTVVLYNVSTSELTGLQQRQANLLRSQIVFQLPPGYAAFNQQRIQQIEDSKRNIAIDLAYFNLVIFILGGGVSYLLAKHTLEPLEESLAAQKRFTADASHELRTPLTAMKSEVEVALRDQQLTLKESKELLHSNLEEIQKLESISNGLLALAKHDEKPLHATTLSSLAQIIENALAQVQVQAKKQEVELHSQSDKGSIKGDALALTEMMVILLDNAIKYSLPKSEVRVEATIINHQALVTVTDHGHGIATEDLPHIFDRFYRAEHSRSKDKVGGYGLGLSIAQKIAEAHKGLITVSSKLDEGSTFTVTLPA